MLSFHCESHEHGVLPLMLLTTVHFKPVTNLHQPVCEGNKQQPVIMADELYHQTRQKRTHTHTHTHTYTPFTLIYRLTHVLANTCKTTITHTHTHTHTISAHRHRYLKLSAAPVPWQNLRLPAEQLKNHSSQQRLTTICDTEHTPCRLLSGGSTLFPLWTCIPASIQVWGEYVLTFHAYTVYISTVCEKHNPM